MEGDRKKLGLYGVWDSTYLSAENKAEKGDGECWGEEYHNFKDPARGLPWQSSGEDSVVPMQGMRVQAFMSCGAAKKFLNFFKLKRTIRVCQRSVTEKEVSS